MHVGASRRWGEGFDVYVYVSMHTDLASIPWWLRSIVSRTDLGVDAVAVHDLLHDQRGVVIIRRQGAPPSIVRLSCTDAIWVLHDIAARTGTSRVKRALAVVGLYAGAWWDWYRVPQWFGFERARSVCRQRGTVSQT